VSDYSITGVNVSSSTDTGNTADITVNVTRNGASYDVTIRAAAGQLDWKNLVSLSINCEFLQVMLHYVIMWALHISRKRHHCRVTFTVISAVLPVSVEGADIDFAGKIDNVAHLAFRGVS